MKSFEGYLKKKLGDSYVLLAGGGERTVWDFSRAMKGVDSNANAVADRGMALVMASLSGTDTTVNPGGKTGWHHIINLTWSNTADLNGSTTNEWCTQIANACGSTDLWVRSRSGGSISAGTNWAAPWTRILTGSNWQNVITLPTVNNASLTLQTAGTTLTTFYANDATNRTFNVTCANIGAATSGHLHDGRYIRSYGNTEYYGKGNYGSMSTGTGINSNLWHVLCLAWNDEYRWNSLIALPTLDRGDLYFRSGLDNNSGWGAWKKIWNESNDGSGSGLDADLLDGVHNGRVTASKWWTTSHVDTWYERSDWDGTYFWLKAMNDSGSTLPSAVAYSTSSGNADTVDGYHYNNLPYHPINGSWKPSSLSSSTRHWGWAYNSAEAGLASNGSEMQIYTNGRFWQREGAYYCLDSGNTYVSSGTGVINETTITQVSNSDTVDSYHANNLAKSTTSETTMRLIAKNQNSTLGMIYGNDNPEGTNNWWHLFLANYNNNSGSSGSDENFWSCQIINRAGTTNPYIRSRAGGNDINSGWTSWSRILTDSNWTSVITLSSLGAAPAHDHPYVRTLEGDVNPSTTYGYWHAMTTLSGISTAWWHIIHMDWSEEANWRSELALPTLHRTGVYYRSDNWEWSSWIMLLDTSSTAQTKSGNLTCANFYTTSDRSKKTNISSFSEHIRKFQLKDTEKWHYGVIAQEVEEMFRDGEEGNMTVNYNSVLSYYVGQLENKVKDLEEKVRQLENLNK